LIISNSKGQKVINAGILPKFNLSNDLKNNFKLVSSLESRQLFIDSNQLSSTYILSDITNALAYKLSSRNSLTLAYTIRLEDNSSTHRIIQQFNSVQKLFVGRLGHRFGIDQTFSKRSDFTFRGRYRISLEKPLQGTQIDPKEFYFKIGNEYLGAIRKNEMAFEFRLTPSIGYEVNTRNKFEVEIDYRLSDLGDENGNTQNFWLSAVWFSSLKP
jgi:hypothetical protein